MYDEGVGGDGSASGPASSHRVRTSHLVRSPVAHHEENRVVIVPFDGGGPIILLCCALIEN
jgi:hypothetical protein